MRSSWRAMAMAGALPQVEALLDDPAPIVRGAAAWALARLDPARFAAAALARLAAERDPEVRAEWDFSVAPPPAG